MPAKTITIDEKFTKAKCLCGAEITAGYDDGGRPCVLHPMPTCVLFNRIENPIDYLHYLNEKRAN